MQKSTIEAVFDSLFKFAVGQELRHKGDTKGSMADMGLLVLKRVMFENVDDDGNRGFERAYHCRMIRFSNSGDIQQFAEKELMTLAEYKHMKLADEQEMAEMREQSKVLELEINKAFGVEKRTHVYLLKEDGTTDESIEYRVSGFRCENGKRYLKLLEVGGLTSGNREFEAESPAQFTVIP